MERKQIFEEKHVSNFTAIQRISAVNENKIIIYRIPSKRKFDGPSSRLKYEEKVLQLERVSAVCVFDLKIGNPLKFRT